MSNYLSSEYRITNPVSSVDLQVVDNTLSTLQGKYDANSALIEQTLAYYNENLKGLRDSDNQYIAEKLKQVKSTIDEYKKKNLNIAYNYNRDSIMSAVKSTLDDPIVQDAIVSRQNYMQYQAQIAKIKEKDSSKYSQQNELFGLEQGGFNSYMQGKTKKLGSMQYTEYINLPAEHSKRLQEYVKNYDDEQYLGRENHPNSQFHTVDIYGKRVLKSDLKNFLETSMDGKERNQLMIDAWYNYKDTKDSDIVSIVKPKYEQTLSALQKQKAEYEASVASGKEKEDKVALNTLTEKIDKLSSKINTNSFNKNDAYNLYSQEYIENMAEAFDKNIITKRDIDDTAFEVAKFYQDKMQWELSFDQKERELALKNKEVGLLEAQRLGTKVETTTDSEKDERSSWQKSFEAKNRMYKEIESELVNSDVMVGNTPFSELTTEQKASYINSLDFSDKTKINGNFSKNLVNKVDEYNQVRKVHVDTYEKTIKNFQSVAISSFQDMQAEYFKPGNDLKIDNVSAYAPTLANVIKDAKRKGKQASWADLSTDVRYAIQAELLNAHTNKNKSNLSGDEYTINKTASYILQKKIKNKNVLNNVQTANKPNELIGGLEDTGVLGLKGWLGDVGTFFKRASAIPGYYYDLATEGRAYADKEEQRKAKDSSYQYSDASGNSVLGILPFQRTIGKTINTLAPFLREEEDLDDIESGDLGGKLNIGTRFRNTQQLVKNQTISNYDKLSPNLTSTFSWAFSTENKAQKPTADLIRQVVLTNEEVQNNSKGVPNSTNNFTITPKGSGYNISYIAKGDKEDEITSVYFSKLPVALQGMVDQTKDNWNRSIYNPSLKLEDFNITPVTSIKESEKIISNIAKYGDNIPNIPLITDVERGLFKPSIEYIRQDTPKNAYEKYKEKVETFLNQDFKVKNFINQNGALQYNIYYKDLYDGGEKVKQYIHEGLIEKDDILMRLNAASKIDEIKKESLRNLK